MSLTNPPPAVSALASMLAACPSITALSISTTAGMWFPNAPNESLDSYSAHTLAAKPYLVLAETDCVRRRFAEQGATPAFSGTLKVDIFSDTKTTGEMEILGRNVCSELLSQSTGLPLRSASSDLANEPEPGQRAADEDVSAASFTSITVIVEYGIEG